MYQSQTVSQLVRLGGQSVIQSQDQNIIKAKVEDLRDFNDKSERFACGQLKTACNSRHYGFMYEVYLWLKRILKNAGKETEERSLSGH